MESDPADESGLTEASARYLLAVLRLWAEDGGRVSTGDLAESLSVRPPSATEMAEKLAGAGYLVHYPHRGFELTARGVATGRSLSRRQCLVEAFFDDLGAPVGAVRALAIGSRLPARAVDRLGEACGHDCLDRCRAGEAWFDGCPKVAEPEVA